MTDPQVEALGVLVGADGPVASARRTAHGFVGAMAARTLVAMGLAQERATYFEVTESGRRAYDEAMGRP
jgi:hypothetical protein